MGCTGVKRTQIFKLDGERQHGAEWLGKSAELELLTSTFDNGKVMQSLEIWFFDVPRAQLEQLPGEMIVNGREEWKRFIAKTDDGTFVNICAWIAPQDRICEPKKVEDVAPAST